MSTLMLDKTVMDQAIIDADAVAVECIYKPEHDTFACTCQGNCDGKTVNSCVWG